MSATIPTFSSTRYRWERQLGEVAEKEPDKCKCGADDADSNSPCLAAVVAVVVVAALLGRSREDVGRRHQKPTCSNLRSAAVPNMMMLATKSANMVVDSAESARNGASDVSKNLA